MGGLELVIPVLAVVAMLVIGYLVHLTITHPACAPIVTTAMKAIATIVAVVIGLE